MPGREAHENPFLAHQTSLPAWRVRLPLPVHQKRILLLFVSALVLAVIGALVGTRLFSRPRQVRSTVTADLRILDARVSEVMSCLGGPGTRVDERKLTRRILERALAEESWPQVVADCRSAALLLYAATSAITASAQTVPGRVPELLQRRYRQALLAAERLLIAVGRLVDDVHRGQRLPSLPHADGVTQAMAEVQTALGSLERLAGFSSPRGAPQPSGETQPTWPTAARLVAELHYGPEAILSPFGDSEGRKALLLQDPGSEGPMRLLVRPLDEAQWLTLPRHIAAEPAPISAPRGADPASPGVGPRPTPPPKPAPAPAAALAPKPTPPPASTPPPPTTTAPPPARDPSLRWLDLDLPEGGTPAVFYSRSTWDPRTSRAVLHLGHFPPTGSEVSVAWTPAAGVAVTAWAGLARGPERLVLLGAPRGLGLLLALLRSRDGGKTFERPFVLADDADPRVTPRWITTTEPLLVYGTLGGALALQSLVTPTPQPAPAPPTAETSPVSPRLLLGAGPLRPLRALCSAAGGRIYLVDGHGRPWVGTLPGGPFVRLRPGAPGASLPGPLARGVVRLACFEGRAALAWSEGDGLFLYTTCDGETCGKRERVSFSRLEDVLLSATRRSVLVLARDAQVIFQRRDPSATGILASARPVALLQRSVRAWALVPGHDSQRLALLLLDGGLGRLRTVDGGRRWLGE